MIIRDQHQTIGDTLDYTISYATWLTDISDTIASVVWKVPPELTQANSSFTTTTATNWISGGKIGSRYTITCTVTTAATPPRTKTASFQLRIEGEV